MGARKKFVWTAAVMVAGVAVVLAVRHTFALTD
jgi:hypothetical protein